MNQIQEIDNFLRYYASIYEQNPDAPITADTIYHELTLYGLSDEQFGNRNIINELYNLKDKFQTSPNLRVFFASNQPGFLQFHNIHANDESKCIKIYYTTTKENIELAANKIFEYIDRYNMPTTSKIAQNIRSDVIVIRLPNIEDAQRIINYINTDRTLTHIAGKTNPFLHREGNVGIGYDDLISYNMTVSILVQEYLQDLRDKNMLNTASINSFCNYLREYYNDTFINCSNITSITDNEHYVELGGTRRFGSLGYAINNFEQVTRLIMEICQDNIDLNNYFNYFRNVTDNENNKKLNDYYERMYKKEKYGPVEETERVIISSESIQLLNEYIIYGNYKYSDDLEYYLREYIRGTKNAITRDNNFRERFEALLSPTMVFQITNGNLSNYISIILLNHYRPDQRNNEVPIKQDIEEDNTKKEDEEKTEIIVYYNPQNNSFYTDIDCKIEINDVPKKIPDLSELYKNGRQVISYNSYNLILQSMSIVKQDEDKTSYVYFNLLDNKYYWDRSCNEPIVGGIDAIGYLEGNKIKAFDGNTYIVKTTDIDKVLEDYIQNIKMN